MTQVNIEDIASYGRAWIWASNVAAGQYKYQMMININSPFGGFAGQQTATSLTDGAGLPFSEALKWDGSISLKNNTYPNSMEDIGQGALSSSGAQSFRYIVNAQTKENPIYLNNPDLSSVPFARPSVYNGVSIYLTKGSNNITYSPKTVDASSTAGVVIHSQAEPSLSSSQTFTFSPNSGGTQGLSLTYSSSNTAGYTTTNGTSSSTSTTVGTSFSTTNSVTVSVGVKDVASASASSSVTQAWSNSWNTMSEVNFSKSNDSSNTEVVSATTIIQPNSAIKNSDGTYGYQSIVSQPGGGSITTTVGFVEGVTYSATITKTASTIQNNFSGTYAIGGSMGYLQDSQYTGLTTNGDGGGTFNLGGGSVSPSVADAIYAAVGANYTEAANISLEGFNVISPTPSPNLQIDFNGSAAGVSTVNNNWSITYSEVAATNASSSGSSSKLMRERPNHINLKDFDTTNADGLGVSYSFDGDSTGKKTIIGTGYPDVVYGSKSGRNHFSKFTDSYLHGNEKADKFKFSKRASGNSIHAFGGNDKINSSSSQTVSMGEGNDVYTINSNASVKSLHRIKLGAGEDKVVVDSVKAQFTIADFNPFIDTVKVGTSLDEDLLSAKLVPFEKGNKILDNATIQFSYNNSPIGVAHLSSDTNFIQELVDPVTHQSILILNSNKFKNKHFNNDFSAYKYFANSVKTGVAYSKPLTPNDWETMDNDQRSEIMSDAFTLGGLDFTEEESLDVLNNHHKPSDFHQVMFG